MWFLMRDEQKHRRRFLRQTHSLVVTRVSYSVFVQEVFVKHSHLFAVQGSPSSWRRDKRHSGSRLGHKRTIEGTLILRSCVSSPSSSRNVRPFVFNCATMNDSFSCTNHRSVLLLDYPSKTWIICGLSYTKQST